MRAENFLRYLKNLFPSPSWEPGPCVLNALNELAAAGSHIPSTDEAIRMVTNKEVYIQKVKANFLAKFAPHQIQTHRGDLLRRTGYSMDMLLDKCVTLAIAQCCLLSERKVLEALTTFIHRLFVVPNILYFYDTSFNKNEEEAYSGAHNLYKEIATKELLHYANHLQKVGNKYGISSEPFHIDQVTYKIHQIAISSFTGTAFTDAHGPVQTVRRNKAIFSSCAEYANKGMYDLSQKEVLNALADFAKELAINGLANWNTGGTTMGNFQGNWAGNVFFDYKKFPQS